MCVKVYVSGDNNRIADLLRTLNHEVLDPGNLSSNKRGEGSSISSIFDAYLMIADLSAKVGISDHITASQANKPILTLVDSSHDRQLHLLIEETSTFVGYYFDREDMASIISEFIGMIEKKALERADSPWIERRLCDC